MGIVIRQRGNLKKTHKFLNRASFIERNYLHLFKKYGEAGVKALYEHTPKDTGKTSESWYYEIVRHKGGVTITWSNSNLENRTPIAILIQYGHSTKTGGFIEGLDYINPALKPIFKELSDELWKEVTR